MIKSCATVLAAAVVLAMTAAAQDSRASGGVVALIGLHGGVAEQLAPMIVRHGITVVTPDGDALTTRPALLDGVDVVLTQGTRNERRAALQNVYAARKAAHPAFRVFAVGGAAAASRPASRAGASASRAADVLEDEPNLAAYYTGGTSQNLELMAAYVAHAYFGRAVAVAPAMPRTSVGLWHPEHTSGFADAPTFLAWAAARAPVRVDAPRIAIVVHSLHLEFQQPEVVKALVAALEARGIVAVAVVDSGEGLGAFREVYEQNLLALKPDAVIHTCHALDLVPFREKLDVAHLHSIFFSRDSIDEWRASAAGLDARTVVFQILTQEILGAIEPLVGGGTVHGHASGEAVVPIPDRIERVAARAVRWAALHRKANADKHVAVVYYDRELDPSALMRGSTTGMFMNAPRSLVKVLARLDHEGYAVTPRPHDDVELIDWMQRGGRQIGLWAPDALDRQVRSGNPVLIPAAEYARWLEESIPADLRAAIIARWGPPPGAIMTWKDPQGATFIVIPRIDLGGVCLLPQPLRGEAHDPKLLHDQTAPPPHNYLATYLWLRQTWRADALVHFGTHGSEFFFPGKRNGLAANDWCDVLLGDLPNINPWIISNLGEVAPAKRRTNAVIVSHATPPVVEAGIGDDLQALHEDVEKFLTLEDGALKERFRKSVSDAARKQHLTDDLHLAPGADALNDAAVQQLDTHLHEIREEKTPTSLHVLGEPPPDDMVVPYIIACLKRRFLDAVASVVPSVPGHEHGAHAPEVGRRATALIDGVVRGGLGDREALRAAGLPVPEALPPDLVRSLALARDLKSRMARSGEELDGLVAALAGRFVRPGPGGSPVRNPAAIPAGRNLYLVNPEEIPARPSWELGRRLVDDFVADYTKRNGRPPVRAAFSLNASATFQDYGVLESEVLAALGCEPVWDEKNVVSDVRVIPLAELGRPRVDVMLSGQAFYRDTLMSRMTLIDRAVHLIADLDEAGNVVRAETARIERELLAKGVAADRARLLSHARIFGGSPDSAGNPGYGYMIDRSGTWTNRADVANAWLAGSRHAYTEGAMGVDAPEAFAATATNTDVVMRTWTDPVRSPLTDRYAWLRGGSLALAIKQVTGREPEFVLSDVRDADEARNVSAADALATDFRVRLFNRKWIEGMMREGYAGADQISNATGNAFGWATMREGSVRADTWQRMKEIFVDDALGLHMREFFEKENPHAFQEMVEVLLESVNKGYWNADAAVVADLARAHAESVARHGESQGLRSAGNDKLAAFIAKNTPAGVAPAPGSSAPGAPSPAAGGAPIVSGPVIAPASRAAAARHAPAPPEASHPSDRPAPLPLLPLIGVAAALLFLAGVITGKR